MSNYYIKKISNIIIKEYGDTIVENDLDLKIARKIYKMLKRDIIIDHNRVEGPPAMTNEQFAKWRERQIKKLNDK